MDYKEVLKDYHLALLECMRQREGAMLNFCGVLITALGGFGWALSHSSNLLLFLSVSLICILILVWGTMSALCMGYYHRCFQKVMSEIEREIYLKDFLPPDWNVSKDKAFSSLWEFLPEIYKWHIVCLSSVIIIIMSSSTCKALPILCNWQRWIFLLGEVVIITILWSIFYPTFCEFRKKYAELYVKKK